MLSLLLIGGCSSGGTTQGSDTNPTFSLDIEAGDFTAVAQVGTNATPERRTWSMTNDGNVTFLYEVRVDRPWLRNETDAFGSCGTSQRVDAIVGLDQSNVRTLPTGTHRGTVQFRNAATGQVEDTRNVTLTVTDEPPPPPPPPPPGSGWTPLVPSTDTRTVYVSSSSGNDSNDGLSEQRPKRTLAAGKALMRNGYPDWLVLKKGDRWSEAFGNWEHRGRSESEPMVITSYGTGNRPLLSTGSSGAIYGIGGGSRPWLSIVGLHFLGREGAPSSGPTGINFLTPVQGLLIEDCMIERYATGIVIQGYDGRFRDVKIRRNVVIDSYAVDASHVQGIYLSGIDGLLLEENVVDHNGWLPGAPGATAPNIFRHNVYVQSDCTGCVARGNFIFNGASHGLQMRSGGLIEGNIFARNSIALTMGGGHIPVPGGVQGICRNNVFLDGKNIDAQGHRGWAFEIVNVAGGEISGNLIAHNVDGTFAMSMIITGTQEQPTRDLLIRDNVMFNWRGSMRINGNLQTVQRLTLRDNLFQDTASSSNLLVHSEAASVGAIAASSGNKFFSAQRPSGQWIDSGGSQLSLSAWKSLVSDTTSVAEQQSFPDSNRQLSSYHASIGGTPSHAAFAAQLRLQSKDRWLPQYTSPVVLRWLRDGYGMTTP